MSHYKERKEKDCLNCGTAVQGKYCHVCGQENIEPKETVWHLIAHFFSDITHFDGNFFSTLKLLLVRPGFLSKEYMIGRRAGYINPVRMYIFTSAFFFLMFFSFFNTDKIDYRSTSVNNIPLARINKMDSATFADFTRNINREDNKPDIPMSRAEFNTYLDSSLGKGSINIAGVKYKSKADYDSLLNAGIKSDSWLKRQFIYKIIAVKEKYKNNGGQLLMALRHSILHSLPQLLFISLPLLALILKLLYYRRKQFYYVNHAIFSIHLYIFFFIILLFVFSLNALDAYLGWAVFTYINIFFYLSMFFYTYKAMRKFYEQRRAKTIIKYLLLLLLFLILMMLLFLAFVFFSFFTV